MFGMVGPGPVAMVMPGIRGLILSPHSLVKLRAVGHVNGCGVPRAGAKPRPFFPAGEHFKQIQIK
jgi:hypothetical protein